MTPTRAIILFAHGSRDPLWSQPMDMVAQRIRARARGVLVQCAFLEMMLPDLSGAVQSLAAAGAADITVVPMFLGVGKHARHDLPILMDALVREHATIRFHLQPAIGEDARLLDLMADIALA